MPRFVDHEQRKSEIIDAVIAALGEGGFKTFTMRSIAKRMGGSSTLITHYFPTRDALLDELLQRALVEAEDERQRLLQIDDPRARLHEVLTYFLPDDEETLAQERMRVALTAHKEAEPAVKDFFAKLEPGMRGLMRVTLEEFVEPEELDGMVDLLRAWTTGVAISAVEHPEIWTPTRQRATLQLFLDLMSFRLKRPARTKRKAARVVAADGAGVDGRSKARS